MDSIRNYILKEVAEQKLSKEDAKKMLLEMGKHHIEENTNQNDEIAIIGMSLKLPGAKTLEQYWELIANGYDMVGDFPEDRRKDTDNFVPKGMGYRKGGYLEEIDKFDASYFRISNREAELMDPNQRLFLETVWEAVEDSGVGASQLSGSKTGVFVGQETNYNREYVKLVQNADELAITGSHTGIMASRISYFLNLKGPSIVIDTACSSSLVALHIACQSLNQNECNTALVGGISISLLPLEGGMVYDSESGKIRAFDKSANGTVWSEGFATILIKPFKKAIEDYNHIYAVIKSTALNNDGTSNGITAPNAETQTSVIQQCWENAKINPDTVDYIETHGTGTKLGDPIEVKGISQAFRKYTNKKQFCGIGSVKNNIGHTVGCSGLASLIKMSLALQNRKLPKTIGFETPNPFIDFVSSPVYVNDKTVDWNVKNHPRRCGVSAFGFSGTNAHVLLEEAPENKISSQRHLPFYIYASSGKTENSFRKQILEHIMFLSKCDKTDIADFCYTTTVGRWHYNYRLILFVTDVNELLVNLKKISELKLSELHYPENGIYFDFYKVVSNKKLKLGKEITEEEVQELSEKAKMILGEFSEDSSQYELLLRKISELYIMGAKIDWTKIYSKGNYAHISIPTYPFDRKRYWIKNPVLAEESMKSVSNEQSIHPLLDRVVVRTMNKVIIETTFSWDKYWILQEHEIGGKSVIPGTTYVEMAVAAGKEVFQKDITSIDNIQFYTPLVMEQEESRKVHTVIDCENEKNKFTILSTSYKDTHEPDCWTVHATGELKADHSNNVPQPLLIDELKKCCLNEIHINSSTFYEEAGPMRYGPRWQNVQKVRIGEREALVELALSKELTGDVEEYAIHPALLDFATSIGVYIISRHKGLYLPFSYGSMKIFGKISAKCYSLISPLMVEEEIRETFKYNVTVADENGKVALIIEDFVLKRVNDINRMISPIKNNFLYNIQWHKSDIQYVMENQAKHIPIIFENSYGTADSLINQYRENFGDIVRVSFGNCYKRVGDNSYIISNQQDDYDNLISDIKSRLDITHIIYMPAIDSLTGINQYSKLEGILQRGLYSLFSITKALLKNKIKSDIDMLILSYNAYKVTGEESIICPENAALFGLAKAICREYLNIHCRLIDMDEFTDLAQLKKDLWGEHTNFLAAYRKNQRYTETLCKALVVTGQGILPKQAGVYVITGGTGGIGLEMARHMAEKGTVNIALLNRSDFPRKEQWKEIIAKNEDIQLVEKINKLREIESLGSTLYLAKVQITEFDELSNVLHDLRQCFGKINGIIHSAGVAGDGFIMRKDLKTFNEVIHPKIHGTWLLDYLTREDQLDFFIMFSSVTSIFSGSGQGDYTAANAYLDSYSALRNKSNGYTLTINWPAWKETGMAVRLGANHDGIFKQILTKDALQAFDFAFGSDENSIIIGALNYEELLSIVEQKIINVSDDIIQNMQGRKAAKIEVQKPESKKTRYKLSGHDDNMYTDAEKLVAQVWSDILSVEELNVFETFYELGGDSILAIKLANRISEVFDKKIDISDVFDYPTVFEMAQLLVKTNTNDPSHLIKKADSSEYYPLSYQQERFYMLRKLDVTGITYNLPFAVPITGKIDFGRVKEVFEKLTRRHEVLRTSFHVIDGRLVQKVHNEVETEIICIQSQEDRKEEIDQFIRPFDLDAVPLFRVGLVNANEEDDILLIDMHHIISDGVSCSILSEEIKNLYNNVKYPDMELQYKDYSVWQKNMYDLGGIKKQLDYWKNIFSDKVPSLNLEYDYKMFSHNPYKSDAVQNIISGKKLDRIKSFVKEKNTTLNNFFFSAYAVLLSKYCKQKDVVIGIFVSGRTNVRLERIIGPFINLLPIRVNINGDETFSELLKNMNETIYEAYRNQDCPYEEIERAVYKDKKQRQNSLFKTMINFHNYNLGEKTEQESVYEEKDDISMQIRNDDTTVDLKMDLLENHQNSLLYRISYNANLFKMGTIQTIDRLFTDLINTLCDLPQEKLEEIKLYNNEKILEADKNVKTNQMENIVISATYTAETVEKYILWWCRKFNINVDLKFAPYNQVFQQLLDESSIISKNKGLNILLVRFEDFIRENELDNEMKLHKIDEAFEQLVNILENKNKKVSYFVAIFPVSEHLGVNSDIYKKILNTNNEWKRKVEKIENVYAIDIRELAELYGITEIFHARKDELGHIPFTDEFNIALSTVIARNIYSIRKQVFKCIVIDCDNTLWNGVCGESSSVDVLVDEPYRFFQKFLIERYEQGMLLALCSKNNEQDVWNVFENNTGMLLKKEHFVSWKINWNRKSENIRQLADELNLGMDSFIFIDDNPVECMEVIDNYSEVLTLQLPENPINYEKFLKLSWAFDNLTITDEDKKRTSMYLAERNRQEISDKVNSIEDFIKSLDLKISINLMREKQVSRIHQLIQKTNQFNSSTIRRTEEEIKELIKDTSNKVWTVAIKDRFGDYGLVGVVIFKELEDRLCIDTFLLSCRVLGRRVEDAILVEIKKYCKEKRFNLLEMLFHLTSKNKPFYDFIERTDWNLVKESDGCTKYLLNIDKIPDTIDYVEFYNSENSSEENKTEKEEIVLDHIAIAVCDIEEAKTSYSLLGYTCSNTVYDPMQNANLSMCYKPETDPVELVEPSDDTSPTFNIVKRFGNRPYHLCFAVKDIDTFLEMLKKNHLKYEVITDRKPAILFDYKDVQFISIKDFGLVEVLKNDEVELGGLRKSITRIVVPKAENAAKLLECLGYSQEKTEYDFENQVLLMEFSKKSSGKIEIIIPNSRNSTEFEFLSSNGPHILQICHGENNLSDKEKNFKKHKISFDDQYDKLSYGALKENKHKIALSNHNYHILYEKYIKQNNYNNWSINKEIIEKQLHKNHLLPLKYNNYERLLTIPIQEVCDINAFDTVYEAPRDNIETELTSIWTKLLGVERVGINDNFYELGGNSLGAVIIEAELEEKGIIVDSLSILQHKTIKELACYIKNNTNVRSMDYNPKYMLDKHNHTDQQKVKIDNVNNSEGKILNDIQPFNDQFYKFCFYNSLFPVIGYLGKRIDSFFANDIVVYTCNPSSILGGDIRYISMKSAQSILNDIGIKCSPKLHLDNTVVDSFLVRDNISTVEDSLKEEKNFELNIMPNTVFFEDFLKDMDIYSNLTYDKSEELVNNIVNAILNEKPVIVWVDCFYEPIRADLFEKHHWPHTILIYGFDNNTEQFYIIEHNNKDNLMYQKKVIKYRDLVNMHKGYLHYFNGEYNTPTFYEFGLCEQNILREKGEILHIWSENMYAVKNELFEGLGLLQEFVNNIGEIILEEENLRKNSIKLLNKINDIVVAKQFEHYRVKRLIDAQPQIIKLSEDVVTNWSLVRNSIAKYIYTSRYNKEVYEAKFKKFITISYQEEEFFMQLYKYLGTYL